jgi:hypothetical protein
MAHARRTKLILRATGAAGLVVPGTSALAAAATVVPCTASGGAGYLFTFRDRNNVQVVLTPQGGSRAALAARGAVRSLTEGALPKAGK